MRNFRRDSKGFTSLELLVASSITLLFALSFYTAFRVLYAEMFRNSVYFESNVSAKNVMDRLARDVYEAVNVQASYNGNTTGTTCLILKLPSVNALGVPTSISSQFDYVTYRIDPSNPTQMLRSLDVLNGTSQREGGADTTDVVIARRISNVAFSYLGTALSYVASATIPTMKAINVNVTAQGTTVGTTQQTQVDSDLMLRNRIT